MPDSTIRTAASVIFDLDGTLTDSRPGILNCLRKALAASGVSWEGPLDWFIGPPVEQSVARLMPHSGEADRTALVLNYRACYDKTGWAENSVYAGVAELLEALQEQGARLYVCTSKRESFALRILRSFGLEPHFTAVYADRGVKPHSKVDLLAALLREQGIGPGGAFMVGDRKFDIEAANANRVRAIAVTYGYGSEEELQEGNPVAMCATPGEVLVAISASISAKEEAAFQPLTAPLSSST